ncbi:MAG: hypothetical protein QXI09_03535 [Candidatus Aenigmatarchaeota archaeon]
METDIFKALAKFDLAVTNELARESEKLTVNNREQKSLVIYNLTTLLNEVSKFTEAVRLDMYSDMYVDLNDLTVEGSLSRLAQFHGAVTVHNLLTNNASDLRETLKTLEEEIYKYAQFSITTEDLAKLKKNMIEELETSLSHLKDFEKELNESNLIQTDDETIKMLTSKVFDITNKLRTSEITLKEKLTQSTEGILNFLSDYINLMKVSAEADQIIDVIEDYFYQKTGKELYSIHREIHDAFYSLTCTFYNM